jgi:hypothetical protein
VKEERPAAVNFARCILCGARIEDGFFSVQAFANGIVLSGRRRFGGAQRNPSAAVRREMAMMVSPVRHQRPRINALRAQSILKVHCAGFRAGSPARGAGRGCRSVAVVCHCRFECPRPESALPRIQFDDTRNQTKTSTERTMYHQNTASKGSAFFFGAIILL